MEIRWILCSYRVITGANLCLAETNPIIAFYTDSVVVDLSKLDFSYLKN